jgi:nucleoside-specific outer membrane channel protein Tsx|tara:strand:- start:76659 stop:77492 length:834 start_codon:yes stop_codon:yes gene_type:complete
MKLLNQYIVMVTLGLICSVQLAHADLLKTIKPNFSTTEIHYQYGNQDNPFTKQKNHTTVITTQNASLWDWGSTFFFVDYSKDNNESDGSNFNDENIYLEAYLNLSFNALFGEHFHKGVLKDVGFIIGTNYSRDPKVVKYTPGIRLAWDVPGFTYLNTDILSYLDRSAGKRKNAANAPAEDDSWFIDMNYLYPFSIKDQKFMITGHAEFMKGRELDDIITGTKKDWFLAQTQIRWDVGNALFSKPDKFYIGTEYQYWNNKLGTDVDEHMAQALAVVRF